jgi:glycosyltransferase involved in cell wall biosynthesis
MSTATETDPILILLSTLTVGGSETKAIRLANALAARGHPVIVAYLNPPDVLRDQLDPAIRLVHLHRRGKFSVSALGRLARLARSEHVRAIVAMNLYPTLYAYLTSWFPGMHRFPLLAWVNTSEFGTRRERLQLHVYKPVLRRMHLTIFGAAEQRRLWAGQYRIDLPDETCTVLYNGVDASHFKRSAVEPIGKEHLPDTRLLVGTVGKMRPEKAHEQLVEAVAALRADGIDVGAVIVGDGPRREAVDAQIRQHGIERYVRIVGETSDVRPWLARMHAFVLSSVAVETFSNAALEAMAMECPIVSSRIGGMEEMLRFGGGLIYSPNAAGPLTQTLRQLLTDPALRDRLASEARHAVETHFGWERMVSSFEDLIARSAHGTGAVRQPLPLS